MQWLVDAINGHSSSATSHAVEQPISTGNPYPINGFRRDNLVNNENIIVLIGNIPLMVLNTDSTALVAQGPESDSIDDDVSTTKETSYVINIIGSVNPTSHKDSPCVQSEETSETLI